jgi:hypothetical protein
MVSSEELIGNAEYVTLQTQCHINRCRHNRVTLHLLKSRATTAVFSKTLLHGIACWLIRQFLAVFCQNDMHNGVLPLYNSNLQVATFNHSGNHTEQLKNLLQL